MESLDSQIRKESADYDAFKNSIKEAAILFNAIPRKESIKVIGHLDADGLCASAIMIHALIKLNRKYSLSILPTISKEALDNINAENCDYVVFVDLGSGSYELVSKTLAKKKIYILDHHMLQSNSNQQNIIQINPHLFHIDGSVEISGAGVVFMFCNELTAGKNIVS